MLMIWHKMLNTSQVYFDWAKKQFRGEDVMQRIQWDIEAFAESVDTKKLTWDSLKESLGLNEGRSINKISKEHSAVVLDMANTVKEWKVAEGDRKSDLLEKLRALNNRKAELEKELDQAVAGKDSSVELALSENDESVVNEKDDAGDHLDKLAELVGNAKDFFAIGKELKTGKYKYDYSDSMMPMYTITADGFKFAILNKRYVDSGDREVGEIAIGLMEAVDLTKKKVESLDESLRNDLKKFIKKNQDELDRLADGEQWEQLYLFLYTEFDVEPESDKAEDLKAAFDLTY